MKMLCCLCLLMGIALQAGATLKVVVNNVERPFTTVAEVRNGTLMMPMKLLGEMVVYDFLLANPDGLRLLRSPISKGNKTVELHVGQTDAAVNGALVTLPEAPYIINPGITMIPIRTVIEQYGHSVFYDEAAATVYFTIR